MTDNELRNLVRPLLLLAQISGLFPLSTVVEGSTYHFIRFKWRSTLTMYSLSVWILSLIATVTSFYYTTKYNKSLTTFAGIKLFVQLSSPAFITPAFIYIAIYWERFIKKWEQIEMTLPKLSLHFTRKVYCIAMATVFWRMGEHITWNLIGIEYKHRCLKDKSFLPAVHLEFQIKYPLLFHWSSFPSVTRITLSLAYQLIMDLQWVCSSLLIIAVSRSLVAQLGLLCYTLERHRDKIMPTKYWQTMRERYNSLSQLTRLANDLLHPAILVSCLNQTILTILLSYVVLSFPWKGYTFHAIIGAFAYHIFINLELLLSMSAILELSKRPLSVLSSVPTALYNQEISRFYNQVAYDNLALSGGKLFDISRSYMVRVVSTLITYEVLLLQAHIPISETSRETNVTMQVNDFCHRIVLPMYNTLLNNSREGNY